MQIRSRVAVLASDSDRIVCFLHHERVTALLARKRVEVVNVPAAPAITRDSRKQRKMNIAIASVVKTVRIVASAHVLEDAWAGSFGVYRERVAPKTHGGHAGIIYSHKGTQERALAA